MKSKKKESKSESDSISNLPPEITNNILVRLPLRDAVRTSILSHKWRYKWATMTHFRFVEENWAFQQQGAEFSNVIDQVLSKHVGPIHKFEVIADLIDPFKVDEWMIFLRRNGIKELLLSLYGEEYYHVHSCLFSCQEITRLELYNCKLNLPPAFKGFTQLLNLKLRSTGLSKNGLQRLISKCTVLQSLELIDVEGCHCLKISSPSLKFLFVQGVFSDFTLVKTPVLAELVFYVDDPMELRRRRAGDRSKIHNILACANSIEKLQLPGYSSGFLARGNKQERLPVVFKHLRSLRLCINFSDQEEIWFLLSLLRSCVYLQELTLKGCFFYLDDLVDHKIWKLDVEPFDFNQLKLVELIDFYCIQPEMEFIKFLLAHAPVLLKMEVSIYKRRRTSPEVILKKLLRFQRASKQAQIICLD